MDRHKLFMYINTSKKYIYVELACPDSNDSHLPMRLKAEAFLEPSRSRNVTQEYLLVRQYDQPSYDRGIGG